MRPSRYTTAIARKMASWLRLDKDDDTIEQLRVGMEIEHEHDDLIKGDMQASAMIAAAHIREDGLYYLWLTEIERFREGAPLASRVNISVNRTQEGPTINLHLEGWDEPLWGHSFDSESKAAGAAELLKAHPLLAVIYAWMIIVQERR